MTRINISVCPTELTHVDGSTYDSEALLAAIGQYVLAQYPDAELVCLQIGHRQGHGWCYVNGDCRIGEELLVNFWEQHGKTMESWQQGGLTYYRISWPMVPVLLVNQFVYLEAPGAAPLYAKVTEITGTIDIPVAGIYHLDGKHALWYARSRKTTSDFDRSRRQQRVLRGLWGEVQEQGIIGQLPDLWGELLDTVQTDLTLNDVLYLAGLGTQIDRARIKNSFLDGQNAHRFTSAEGASVFYFNYDEISQTLKSAFEPQNLNRAGQPAAVVEVLNGTGQADWDAVATDRQNWAGYAVSRYGPAARADYVATVIYDLRSTPKGSRLSELGRLFRVSSANLVSAPDPEADAEYRIILGADWEPCQRSSVGVYPTRTPTPTPTPTDTAVPQ
jgi:hypothetical protein